MVTISRIVQKMLSKNPFLQEALSKGIISYASLARQMQKEIEEELGKEAKPFAIMMALRRYAEKIRVKDEEIKFDFQSEVTMKTNLCDICVRKSPKLMSELKNLYAMVDFDKGDTFNVSQGNYEISIVTNEKYSRRLMDHLNNEKILDVKNNLVSLSLRYPQKFFETPGVIFQVIRNLAWENINIYEAISTHSEFTLVVSQKDSVRAYKMLQNMTESGS
jgi:aspartokinase